MDWFDFLVHHGAERMANGEHGVYSARIAGVVVTDADGEGESLAVGNDITEHDEYEWRSGVCVAAVGIDGIDCVDTIEAFRDANEGSDDVNAALDALEAGADSVEIGVHCGIVTLYRLRVEV